MCKILSGIQMSKLFNVIGVKILLRYGNIGIKICTFSALVILFSTNQMHLFLFSKIKLNKAMFKSGLSDQNS